MKIEKKNILKAVRAVDFTKYALSPISHYVCSGRKLANLKNAVNLSKIFFSVNKVLMHIYNMSETYLQSIKMIH